ncbi:hypothetical protein BS78_05G135300 [Paspalum vaginatum]|nr:hypothetical protein BS78_05G135300 [Paspalum vaginatum]
MPTPQPPPAPPPLPAAPRTPVIPHHPWPQSTAPPAEAPQYPQPPISCAFGPAASVAVATSLRQFGGSQPPSRSRCLPLFAAVAIVASVLGTAPVPSAPAAFSSPVHSSSSLSCSPFFVVSYGIDFPIDLAWMLEL